MSQINLSLAVVFLIACLVPCAADAATEPELDPAPELDWTLRFGFVVVDTDGGVNVSTTPGNVHVDIGIGTGGGGTVSLERRVSPLLGIEFGISGVVMDMRVSTDAGTNGVSRSTATVFLTPVTIGANFHLVPEGPVDFYIGPVFAVASYRTISVGTRTGSCWWWECDSTGNWSSEVRWRSDSDPTWGARLGAGFSFGEGRWSLETSLMYIDTDYDFRNHSDDNVTTVEIDPLMLSIAAGFKF